MRFEQFETDGDVARAATDLLADVVRAKPDARVILPAGRTPLAFYDEVLARAQGRGQRDDRRALTLTPVRFVQLDEYVGCGPKEARSFHALLRNRLLVPLRRAGGRDLLIDGSVEDPQVEAERHAARLAALGGADVAFLGIGRNGHVAFNEPGATLGERARVVELARETRQAAEEEFGKGRGPTRGITLGLQEIAAARRVVLLATGAAKATILAALFDEPPSSERPASLLLGHAHLTILADAAAAELLHAPLPAGAPSPGTFEAARDRRRLTTRP